MGKGLAPHLRFGGVEGDGGIKRFALRAFQLNNRETPTQGTKIQAGTPSHAQVTLGSLSSFVNCLDQESALALPKKTQPTPPIRCVSFSSLQDSQFRMESDGNELQRK